MSFPSNPIAIPTRSALIATLLGAAMLVTPLMAARAETAENGSHHSAKMKGETVEQRIETLHSELKITSDEEASWTAVAQAMRDNAAAMDKLTAEQADKAPGSMTAPDDLKTYERFAHAHFDGLKNLVSSFDTLYATMPDAQKKLADHVFQTFGHEHAPSHT
jgi:hypothetical protein